jgi:hypothetical protein
VASFSATSSIRTGYGVEPTANIAVARNNVVKHATEDYLAFIDDGEFPAKNWLLVMLMTCKAHGVAGDLAPVIPHFDVTLLKWLINAGFYDRASHVTDFVFGCSRRTQPTFCSADRLATALTRSSGPSTSPGEGSGFLPYLFCLFPRRSVFNPCTPHFANAIKSKDSEFLSL